MRVLAPREFLNKTPFGQHRVPATLWDPIATPPPDG